MSTTGRGRGRDRGSGARPAGPAGLARILALGLALLLAAATSAVAQETGRIAGKVTHATTGEPLIGAQVVVAGTGIGTVTDNRGRYLLADVPAGERTVTAQLIGYARETREVTVPAGGTAAADLVLRTTAIAMEELVVTGTAGAARRREVGNSIGAIGQEELKAAALADVGDVIQGRALGAVVMDNSGMVGAGSTILLRGNNSITMNNTPLIYVDGIRVQNKAFPGDPETNQAANPFDDLNPQDIERVEIVKGAAAATLYGTEAAGGVIQIFTKRGASGAPAWSFGVEQGINNLGYMGPQDDPTGLNLKDCTQQDPPDASCPSDGSWTRNGHVQRYNLSVRGGAGTTTYYLSGKWGREEGIVDPQHAVDYSLRGNFGFAPSSNLRVDFNNAYSRRRIRWLPDGNNAEGFLLNVFRGGRGYTPNNEDARVLDMQLFENIDHFTTGVALNWDPATGMMHRLTAGLDWVTSDYQEERPWGFYYQRLGSREDDQYHSRMLTLDYAGTWQSRLPGGLASSFSWGGQLYDEFRWQLTGYGDDFAGPGDKVVNSAAVTRAEEDRFRLASGGFYLQEMIGWKDRLFVTGGIRWDGFSTFGEGFGLAMYPKVSLSYMVSDHGFWPEWWESMKLRAAVGESGKAPGLFDADRVWEAASGDEGQPGVTIANLGNPDLGPEKTRETEAGFEGTLLDDRVAVDFTWYRARTYDGLVRVLRAPSLGTEETQLMNVGEFVNHGIEASLDVNVLRRDGLDWRVGARYSTNESEVLSLGGLQSISLGWRQYLRPGYPIPAYFHDVVQNPDEMGVKPVMDEEYLGAAYPTRNFGLSSTLNLFRRLTLNVLGEGQTGHVLSSGTAYQNVRRSAWPYCAQIQAMIKAGDTDGISARQRAECDTKYVTYGMWVRPADFFKIRSASITYRIPEHLLFGGAESMTLMLKGRNLWTSTDFPGIDPEAFEDGARDFALYRQEYYNLPPLRSFILGATVNF